MEGRAFAKLAFRPHASAMSRNDSLHICQPYAGALEFFSAMEPLKDAEKPVGVRHVEADAVVAHKHLGLSWHAVATTNLDRRLLTCPRVLERIRQEVCEDELQHVRISRHLRQRIDDP